MKKTRPLSSNANRRWQLAVAGAAPATGRKATSGEEEQGSDYRGVRELELSSRQGAPSGREDRRSRRPAPRRARDGAAATPHRLRRRGGRRATRGEGEAVGSAPPLRRRPPHLIPPRARQARARAGDPPLSSAKPRRGGPVPGEGGSRWSSAANRTSPAGRRGSRFPADHSSCRPPIRSCAGRRTRVEPPPPAAPPVAPSLPRPVVGGGAEAEQQQRLGEGVDFASAVCLLLLLDTEKMHCSLSLSTCTRQANGGLPLHFACCCWTQSTKAQCWML
jgi:hypothetical protein